MLESSTIPTSTFVIIAIVQGIISIAVSAVTFLFTRSKYKAEVGGQTATTHKTDAETRETESNTYLRQVAKIEGLISDIEEAKEEYIATRDLLQERSRNSLDLCRALKRFKFELDTTLIAPEYLAVKLRLSNILDDFCIVIEPDITKTI